MVEFIHHLRIQLLVDVIVQVHAGAGGHDGLDFREKGVHIQTLGSSDGFQVQFTVDGLDDINLVAGTGGNGFHHEIVGAFYLVFLHVFGDKLHEGLAEFVGLAFSHSLAFFRQLLEGERITDGHVFQGRIRENDPGLEPEFAGHILSEVLEHGQERGVSPTAAMDAGANVFVVLVHSFGKGAVLHQHYLVRMFQELATFLRSEDKSVIINVFIQIMQNESLVDYSDPETLVVVFSCTVQGQFVVVVGLDERVGHARQDAGQVFQFETLRQGLDELQDQAEFLPAVEAGLGVQAVVAGAASIGLVILAEVIEQKQSAALAGFGIGHRFLEELFADFLFRHRLSLHEFLQFLDVLVAVIGDALTLLSIAAGAAGFLIIALYTFGNIVMDHETDVRLVDTHAEGDGGHNHIHFLHEELVLIIGPGFGIQTGVVREGLDAVDAQCLGHFLHLLTAEAVNDAGFAGILADEADDVFFRIHLVPHFVIQIGPIEGRFEHPGVLDAEVLEDVALHFGRGRGGEGDHRRRLDLVYDGADFPIFRTEVVAPFGDAVGLIHGVEGDFDFLQERHILLFGEGFRRHIQQFGDALEKIGPYFGQLNLVERRIEEMGDTAVAGLEAADYIHLVLHKGDERGNHDGRSVHHQGRQLVAQRLAAAGGHEHKRIVSFYQMLDDLFLITFECIVAEEGLQFGLEDGRLDGHGGFRSVLGQYSHK